MHTINNELTAYRPRPSAIVLSSRQSCLGADYPRRKAGNRALAWHNARDANSPSFRLLTQELKETTHEYCAQC